MEIVGKPPNHATSWHEPWIFCAETAPTVAQKHLFRPPYLLQTSFSRLRSCHQLFQRLSHKSKFVAVSKSLVVSLFQRFLSKSKFQAVTSSDPLFSVLLPTHARADVIGLAIKSVLAQTEVDFELLVVGDGAEPGTAEAVAAVADPRVRWFDLPKAPGFGYANRNRVLAEARGRYIAHMCDDDLVMPDHLACLRAMLDAGAVLAATRAIWVSSDGIGCPFPTNLDLPDEAEAFRSVANCSPSACFAYRRDALDVTQAWPNDGTGAGDWKLWKRILQLHPDRPLVVDPSYTVFHFSARRQKSRSSSMQEMVIMLDLADRYGWWPAALRHGPTDDMSEQARYAAAMSEPGGVAAMRRGAALVTDRLAWTFVQKLLPTAKRKLVHAEALHVASTQLPDDFDATFYLRLNPDVADAGMDAAHHWLKHGQFEGRGYR